MRFAFTDDQLLLRDTVREFLANECQPEQVRYTWVADSGHLPEVWSGLADMGVLGLTVPEAHGGLGMDELDLVLLLEETGRVALPSPVVETTAVAAPLLAAVAPAEHRERWLTGIATGECIVGVGFVGTPFVLAAHLADLVILERDDRVFAVAGDKLTLERQRSVDGSRWLFDVDWRQADEIPLVEGPEGWHEVNLAFDRGALGTAAQLLGLADRMLEMTVEYAKQREQFGVPIGSFQAVKHQIADALLALSFARPAVYNAAYAMRHGLDTHSRDVSMAKCLASEAALTVGRTALQCHGAIGYTTEYDLHLWMKRAWALAASWGDAAWHRDRVSLAVLGPRP
ncbi:MAG: acyl-CoA/acyl-ACP dehydrogenase [Acidimicrobiales bacterium]|jgi:alkylation response protein AidB-like acyl-CoA dehydrogenase|nr:acyl-CoA/acyl-ACP dehydrogenase [Acidimicrobiales bacterium]